ncbi:MAG TPA: AEC family transporter [Ignavibacteriaceae bacterium]|nr:AEC family transporter [Ignavibacteriaceae bacterium]
MENLIFIINLVAPVFIIVALGFILKTIGLINENFVNLSSKIVFTVSLPALIFVEIYSIDLKKIFDLELIVFVYAGTLLSFFLSWAAALPFIPPGKDRGVFIQGSFRGNFAIVGLALIANVLGAAHLGKASLLVAAVIPLYNVLSVIVLTTSLRSEKHVNFRSTFFEILKNPLILAVVAAVVFSVFKIPVPHPALKTIEYLSALSLPLALIGIGGFMSFSGLKKDSAIVVYSTFIKLVLIPLLAVYIAYFYGFRGENLGIIFILFACPTAVASFIMAEAMGLNGKLAGNILLLTTFGSVLTITLGLFILKEFGLI